MDKFWFWIAYKLPRKLVYFAVIRLGAEVTTGEWSNTVVPELSLMDAISRWDKP